MDDAGFGTGTKIVHINLGHKSSDQSSTKYTTHMDQFVKQAPLLVNENHQTSEKRGFKYTKVGSVFISQIVSSI